MKIKYATWLFAGTIIGASAVAAFAHGGATGIVRERMDGMSAMGDAVKSLSNMFRSGNYDAELVASGADAILKHSGEQLVSLFPEGSGGMPSEAKPEIWADFDDFAALANQLDLAATALKANASNLQSTSGAKGAMMGGGMTSNGMGASAMGGAATMITAEMLAAMPADKVFDVVVRTCASCHTKYRIDK